MEFDEFVVAYHREPGRYPRYQAEVEARLADVRRIAAQWGELLYEALALGRAPLPQEWNAYSNQYWQWTQDKLGGVSEWATQWVTARLDGLSESDAEPEEVTALLESLAQLGSEVNFHRMNAKALPFWASLLSGQASLVGRETVEWCCVNLANEALLLAQARDDLIDEDLFFDPDARALRGVNTGALTEIDAYIALLDLTRRDRRLLVLPGPPQFERWARSANADFLVIDTEHRRIRGVQVKSVVERQQAARYDRARITLIDGARDLQNSRAVRTDARRSDRHVVSWPGMISAHYLRELRQGPLTDRWIERRQLMQLKFAARHFTGTVTSQNRSAYAVVRDRVAHDLAARTGEPG
ncbi:hypothetical protein RB608_18535 [Nocardioides sp. LHD-245]|uniref:hypothetical protein n=1 Tax=Nocardioides sp. LHD-245 TaxID=3051387 RepID=UPI0027E0B7E4|nr:hypothetical protein [Nocardioides sp. LHD-245]